MGKVKIRYYVTRRAWAGSTATWGYWIPSRKMRAAGFKPVACGEDGPAAWAIAQSWNERWDAWRRSGGKVAPGKIERVYPPASLGEAYARFRATETWRGKAPRTREDWERGWKHIEPIFGDVDPKTIALEQLDVWYAALLKKLGVREAHRAMKIWRALWRVAGAMKYCEREGDPSLGVRRKTPQPRNAIWREGEAVRLVKRAWRMGYRGLAAALAVAWDTQLSPIDVSGLTGAQLRGDAHGQMFSLERAKTGKAAIGTLGKRSARLLKAYLAALPATPHPSTPLFLTRGGEPGPKGGRPRPPSVYTRDKLGKDFKTVRDAEFPGDTRKLMDFRRSGAIEAIAGQVDPAALAGKMANTIDQNRELQSTYLPHNAAVVRLADAARVRGRSRMRDGGKS